LHLLLRRLAGPSVVSIAETGPGVNRKGGNSTSGRAPSTMRWWAGCWCGCRGCT